MTVSFNIAFTQFVVPHVSAAIASLDNKYDEAVAVIPDYLRLTQFGIRTSYPFAPGAFWVAIGR